MAADQLVHLFSEVLGVPTDQLNDDTSPDNTAQWDSMRSMELIAVLEDTFNIRLSTKEIMRTRSIKIVREVLHEKNVEIPTVD
jgi:acyl carrier protein